MTSKEDMVKFVVMQTNYTEDEAEQKLQESEYNYVKVIKNYLNPNFTEKKAPEKNRSTNEKMMDEIMEKHGLSYDEEDNKPKRSRRISQSVKDKVWNRDGGKCVLCGSNENIESMLIHSQSIEDIRDFINTMPEALKTAFTLRESEGKSYEEISIITNTPIGTVRSRIFRARESIIEFMQKELMNNE